MKRKPLLLMITWVLFNTLLGYYQQLNAQDRKVAVACIAFYNVENLFDTIDSPDTNDTEYTAQGSKKWDGEKYSGKI